jgi:hypothetical protein
MTRSLVALLFVLLTPSLASARKQQDYTYRYEQVWSASVRMVRVDLRLGVDDQDETIGYLLFQYRDTLGRPHPGSIELVRTQDERGANIVRAVVQIPAMPSYIEQMIVDRLARKLREEFGDPPVVRAPPREGPREGDETETEPAPRDASRSSEEEAREEPSNEPVITRRPPERVVTPRRPGGLRRRE